jgi:hypothetical protein
VKRNVKELQIKSRAHTVLRTQHSHKFVVESGNPNSVDGPYFVEVHGELSPTCTCAFKARHPDRLCSHGLAVLDLSAQSHGRHVSLWATEGDAKRQRCPVSHLVEGDTTLWLSWKLGGANRREVRYPNAH